MTIAGVPVQSKLRALNDAFYPTDANRTEYDDSADPVLGVDNVQGALDGLKSQIASGAGSLYALTSAALATLGVNSSAASVYLASRRRVLNYDGNSVLTVDNTRVFATADGGNTRWIDKDRAGHPYWRRQATFFIDATNGDDDNTGLTALAPIKTWDELLLRWGSDALISSPTGTMTITVAGDTGINDPVNMTIILSGGMTFRIQGALGTASRTGGTLATFTALNRATTQGFTSITAADAATWTSDVGKRVRITQAGGRQNAVAWVIKNVSGAGKVGSFTKPADFFQTPVTPQAGDSYDVDTLPRVCIGGLTIKSASNTTGAFPTVSIVDLDMGFGSSSGVIQPISGSGVVWNFRGCRFRSTFNLFGGFFFAENCCFSQGFQLKNTYGHIAGGVVGAGSSGTAACIISDGASVTMDDDVIVHGTSGLLTYPGGSLVITRCGIFNTAITAGVNANGDGIVIGASIGNANYLIGGGTVAVIPDAAGNDGYLYGDANAGYGLRIGAFAGLTYADGHATLAVTGTDGDYACGTMASTLASVDPATHGLASAKAQAWATVASDKTIRNPTNCSFITPCA